MMMYPGHQVAYGQQQFTSPVSLQSAPISMPTAGMVMPQHMVRGIPGAPVTLPSAPVTVSAPPVMSAPPVTVHQVGTMGTVPTVIQHAVAPTMSVVQPTVSHTIPHNLLAGGQVIHSGPIRREDLLAQGRLVADPQKEHELITKTSQIPGAMSGPHSVTALPSQHVIMHTQPQVFAHEQPAVYAQPAMIDNAAPAPESLEVSILQANNLASLNKFTGQSMSVTCQVVHRTGHVMAHGCPPTLQSSQADPSQSPDPLNPVWNECHVLEGFFPGDSLQFTIHDIGIHGTEVNGITHMDTEHFYHAEGFEGELAIDGVNHATLSIRIRPLGPMDQQAGEPLP